MIEAVLEWIGSATTDWLTTVGSWVGSLALFADDGWLIGIWIAGLLVSVLIHRTAFTMNFQVRVTPELLAIALLRVSGEEHDLL